MTSLSGHGARDATSPPAVGRAAMARGERGLTAEVGRVTMAQCVRSLAPRAGIPLPPAESHCRCREKRDTGEIETERIIFST
jgi:hypothetical protein